MKKTVSPRERASGYPPEDPMIDFLHARACRHASGAVHMDLTRSVPASPWWKSDTWTLPSAVAGTANLTQLIHALGMALYWELLRRAEEDPDLAVDWQLELPFDEE